MTRTYQRTADPKTLMLTEDGQITWIPVSQDNGAYRQYVADGGDAIALPADPLPVIYSGTLGMQGRLRTTDATVTELYRATLAPLTGYRALATLLGVDAGNGNLRMISASIVAKRLGAGALLVGAPVVLANHADAGAATWAITANVSGSDFVISVTGAAGRSIDWLLSGEIIAFTPGGA